MGEGLDLESGFPELLEYADIFDIFTDFLK